MGDVMRNELEERVGVEYSSLTQEERAAVDRIKNACSDLTQDQKKNSPTDIIMDLSVAIVAEMRRAAEEAMDEMLASHDRRDSRPD